MRPTEMEADPAFSKVTLGAVKVVACLEAWVALRRKSTSRLSKKEPAMVRAVTSVPRLPIKPESPGIVQDEVDWVPIRGAPKGSNRWPG